MLKPVSPLWMPICLLVIFMAYWAGHQGAKPPGEAAAARRPAASQPSLPAPSPSAEKSTSPSATATAAVEHKAVSAPASSTTTTSQAPSTSREPSYDTTAEGEKPGTPWGETKPRSSTLTPGKEGQKPWGTAEDVPGTSPPSRFGERQRTGGRFGTPSSDQGTTATDTTANSTTEKPTAEVATAFHLFDGFETANHWAVESASDHAELALAEERVSEGQKSLKAAFKAFGKGNFELRREVALDLTDATALRVDVFNEAGPLDLALGLRAGYNTTLFMAPPKPLATGWNRDITFPLTGLSSSEKGAWGSSWAWSRDSVSRISLIFQEKAEKEGVVHIDNLRFDQPTAKLGAKTKPVLKAISASAEAVERYETLELTVDFEADYQNFFDRSEVDLFGSFFSPSGKKRDAAGFVADLPDGAAKPVWKIRFAPNEVGLWRYDVTVKSAGGDTTSATYRLLCRAQADRPGFIRVSKSDPRYFELDSGAFYYPLGQNVCWAANYDYYLEAIQGYGGNHIRIWLCPWNLQLEDPKEPGKYDLRAAKALDELLEKCRSRGIYVQLVLRYHGMQTDSWDKNPYNSANGGPCTFASDFFTDSKARDLHKRFLEYVVARWGHSTAVFAWELWNEVDLARCDREDDLVAWHRDMAGHLKKIDVHGHLVTTSVSSPGRYPKLFELPEIDFVPVHFYARDVAEQLDASYTLYRKLRKPIFVGEFSAGHRAADDLPDTRGTHLHAGLWLTFVTPFAGNAMPWWWDTFVDKNKLYPHWAALGKFAKDVDRRGKSFELVQSRVQVGDDAQASLQGLVAPSEAYLWVYDPARITRTDHAERPLLFAPRPVKLHGLLGGKFRVEIWDTLEGKVLSESTASTEDGSLAFTLPKCDRDIAVRIRKEPAAKALPPIEW